MNNLEIIFEIFQITLKIYLGVFSGFLSIKIAELISPKFPIFQNFKSFFVKITIDIFTPILIIISIYGITSDNQWIFPALGGIVIAFFGIGIPKLIARFQKKEAPDPAELCTAAFPNALNFPFPILIAFSQASLGIASIFLASTTVMRNSVGLYISGVKITKKSIKEVLTFMPIWGVIFGFILKFGYGGKVDYIIYDNFTQTIFTIGIFATLMTVGFSLKKPNLEYKDPLIRVGFVRFVFSLILAVGTIFIFKLSTIVSLAFFVQFIAPPAVNNGIYAERFGLNTTLTSQIIVTLTLIALMILPLELLFIQFVLL